MKRIFWSKNEELAVLAHYHLHIQAGKTNTDAYIEAQNVLPEDRRRGRVPSVIFNFNKVYKHRVSSGHIPSIESIQISTSSIVQPPPAAEAIVPFAVIEKKIIIREEPDYGRIPTTTLARILFERLAASEDALAMLAGVQDALGKKRTVELEYDRRLDTRPPEKQPEPEDNRIRVCVVGLLPIQQQEVETAAAKLSKPIKLRFYDSHSGAQDFPAIVDYIIITRHTTHAWWEKAKATLPSDCVFFTEGGASGVIRKLYDVVSRQQAVIPQATIPSSPYVRR